MSSASRFARIPPAAQVGLLVALFSIAGYLWSASWRAERFYQTATLAQLQTEIAHRPDDTRAMHYLALRLQEAGRSQEALDMALRAAEKSPFDEDAYRMAAAFSGRIHGDQSAFDILSEFVRRNPNAAGAHRALALLYQKNGAHERAFAEATKATNANPKDADSFRIAADEARVMHKADIAEANARRAVALAPDDPRSHLSLAAILDLLHRPAEAHASAETAVKADPNNGDAHYFLGDLLRRQNQNAAALAQMTEAARLLPDNGDPRREIGRLQFAQGQYAEARAALESARAALPDDSVIAFLLTATCKRLGDAPAAAREEARFAVLKAYQRRIADLKLRIDKRVGGEEALRRELARLLAFHGDIDGARQQYRLLILHRPDDAAARHEFAALEALATGDEAKGRSESQLASFLHVVDRAIAANQAEKAVAPLEAALKAHPDAADLHNRLGRALGQAIGVEDRAEAEFLQATKREPRNADFALDAAEMLATNKKPDAAETEYRRALTLSPTDAKIRGAMGRFLANESADPVKNAEGERFLRDLLTSDPANGDALYGLGMLSLTRGDGKAAARYLETFLTKTGQREWTDVWFALARAYQLSGNPEKAAQARAQYARLTAKPTGGSGP